MASILGKPGGPGQFPTHDLSTVMGALQRETRSHKTRTSATQSGLCGAFGLIDDRRFAETIYRLALADGIMDRVTYQDPPICPAVSAPIPPATIASFAGGVRASGPRS